MPALAAARRHRRNMGLPRPFVTTGSPADGRLGVSGGSGFAAASPPLAARASSAYTASAPLGREPDE